MTQRVLFASPNYWHSPFQVGSHHLARAFARAGWDVAYLSDPISPWHLARGLTPELKRRFAIWRAGGENDVDGKLWTYQPAALLTPHGKPVLRSAAVHRHWHRWTWPSVVRQVKDRGFGAVDLLYIDSVHQSFWLDAIRWRQSVFRVADYNPQFEKYTAATHIMEEKMARRVDLVLYPSPQLKDYAERLGSRRTLYLPNGVDFEHFAGQPLPRPVEYADLPRPIAVYMGVMPVWFHFEWVREAARQRPEMSFVLIGPEALARKELAGLGNVHILGCRPYETVPAYLQHADVGLLPFDARRDPRAVAALNPQKMYAYLAAGLPVVATRWQALEQLDAPVRRCGTLAEFIAGLRDAVRDPGDTGFYRRYAARFSWRHRLTLLLDALGQVPIAAAARLAG